MYNFNVPIWNMLSWMIVVGEVGVTSEKDAYLFLFLKARARVTVRNKHLSEIPLKILLAICAEVFPGLCESFWRHMFVLTFYKLHC